MELILTRELTPFYIRAYLPNDIYVGSGALVILQM